MARITPPEARAILAEINLSPASLGKEEDSEVLRDINSLLPDIVRGANMQVDLAAQPLDFPFSDEAIVAASPWKEGNAEAIEQEREDQQGEVRTWILLMAAARIVGRAVGRQRSVAGGGNAVKDRYDELKALADEAKTTALASIARVAGQTSGGAAVQQAGNQFPSSTTIARRRVW